MMDNTPNKNGRNSGMRRVDKRDLDVDSTTRFKCVQSFKVFWVLSSPFGEHEK